MNQPCVHRHAVQKRLERGTRRTQRADHVHMAKAPRVVDVHRPQVRTHRHVLGLDHHNGRRGVVGQPGAPTQQQVFKATLQVGIQCGADQRRAVGAIQAPRQQRRQAWLQTWSQQQRLLQCFVHRRLWPHPVLGHAPQHFVARHLRPRRVPVRAQPARGLWQHGQQRRFGMREVLRRLAQVGPTGRRNTLQRAAKRRAIEVQVEDLVLGQMPFQLGRAPQLAHLAGQCALVRIEQARNLHRQGAAARQHAPAREVLPRRTPQRQRVNAGVTEKPAVLIGQQRVEVIRRHLVRAHRVAPHAVGIGEAPQRCAVFGQHHAGQVILGQRQRPHAVGQPQQGARQ